MARKDEIFKSFMKHQLLSVKYYIAENDIPSTVYEGLRSDTPIVKAIALIVEGMDGTTNVTESALRTQVTQYLNGEL